MLPSYIPVPNKPKPDIPAKGPLYEDAYLNYPANPLKSVPQPPGNGGTVSVFVQLYTSPPTPFDQNPAWKEVNRQINANMQLNMVPIPDYPAKLATVLAGGDLPDIISLSNGLTAAPSIPQFIQAQCADLTPYLAGDTVKDYPNLANIPTFAWKNSGAAINGKLYMIPIERYAPGNVLIKNETFWNADFAPDYTPKNLDDFKRVLQTLNRPSEGRYAIESYQGQAFDIIWYAERYGAPNNWALDASGKLTKNFETPEFKAAVGYVRDLVATGLYHPDTLNHNITQTQTDIETGKMALLVWSFGINWSQTWRVALQQKPPINLLMVKPFPAQDGGKVVHFLGAGTNAATVLKQAPPDRIKEMLRIMNFLAAPFGSQEDLLLTSGVKDTDYTLDDKGNPILTSRGNPDAYWVSWKYIASRPQVIYLPDIPNYMQTFVDAEAAVLPYGVSDPTLGFTSDTAIGKGPAVNKALMDGVTDIIAGRRPLTDFDQLVKDWQAAGGNQMRSEYQQAIAAAG
ncbi:MAG: hypothetical protein JO247_01295 [Chloroflexi bacterium]|nr:hypothetical protein [Chloroflexota bacterium]